MTLIREGRAAVRVLDGPPVGAAAESFIGHRQRLGPLPTYAPETLIGRLEHSGLLGRGGAGFPVGRKWRSVAERSNGSAVVLANGAEGEPLSRKDHALMAARPHLVIDGALLAAGAVDARDIIFYVGAEHRAAEVAMQRALAERSGELQNRARLVSAPPRYVAGEESAAVHFVNAGDARPTTTPPRPYEHGVGGRPTLVQNVESLALAALVARGQRSDTGLLTLSGAVQRGGVQEVDLDSTVGDAAEAAGGLTHSVQAVLLGGYFGAWVDSDDVWTQPLEPQSLRARGLALGCGVVHFLRDDACGVDATARIMAYLASQSARQCGPCVFGLEAIADASRRLAIRSSQPGDVERLARWSGALTGRGACKHPDGATAMLRSALAVFADDFAAHERRRTCLATAALVAVA